MEFSPGDIVTFFDTRYTILAGPDSMARYVMTSDEGIFVVRSGDTLVLVTPTPSIAEDTLTEHLRQTVERLQRIDDRLDIQDGFASKLTVRLANVEAGLRSAQANVNDINNWRKS